LATVKIHTSCDQLVHGLAAVWHCCSSKRCPRLAIYWLTFA